MTNEEVERAISFLLESRAKHDAQLGELRKMVAETNRAVQMMAGSQSGVNGMLTQAVADLIEGQRQMQAGLRDLAAEQQRTQAQLREMDARLNALIGVVERLAAGGGG